jgi:hypothetical protein
MSLNHCLKVPKGCQKKVLNKLLEEANRWQAGGTSYTVQCRGPVV